MIGCFIQRQFNKQEVLRLAEKGIEITEPKDIIKDPYVFEFLGIPEDKPILESSLEKALVAQIEKFFLELGRTVLYLGNKHIERIHQKGFAMDDDQ